MRHSNVISSGGVRSSVPRNSNVVLLLLFGGASSIEVLGGDVSTGSTISHSYSAGSSASLPWESVAMMRRRCSPGRRLVYVIGGVQGTNGSRSSEHSNVASATLD